MELENRLKSIRNENIIWFIYFIIIGFCLYANKYEKEYFLTGNEYAKKMYRYLSIGIFTVATLIYLYFVYTDYQAVKNLKCTDSEKKKNLTKLASIGSLFILMSGIIFIYILYEDQDIETEIAFN